MSDQNEPEATPISDRPSRRQFSQNVRFESYSHQQDKVVLRRSTHECAESPREAWHTQTKLIRIEGRNHVSEQVPPRQSVKFEKLPVNKISSMNQRLGGAPNVALKATSITPYERIRAAAARSKVTTNPNKAQYDPDLVKCHLCPEVGTFSVIRKHIVKYHSEWPLQTEHNKKTDHLRSSPPPQRQRGGSEINS